MANCPKCNAHLRIFDWRPECPKCGVNMVYYGMEERLLEDAEKAEAEHARFQKRIDRMKASTVGGSLQIARIVFSVLPVAGLFLKLASINVGDAPYIAAHNVSVNILKLVDFFTTYLDVNGLLGVIGSQLVGKAFIGFTASILLLVLSVLMILLTIGRLFCSAQKKSCVKNVVVSVLAIAFVIGSSIAFGVFAQGINAVFPAFISASVGYGVYVYAALFIPSVVVNVLFAVKPMEVKYTELPDYTAEIEEEAVEEAVAD